MKKLYRWMIVMVTQQYEYIYYYLTVHLKMVTLRNFILFIFNNKRKSDINKRERDISPRPVWVCIVSLYDLLLVLNNRS